MRIEICGGIASGKTTLAKLLAGRKSSAALVLEDFRANPFWRLFYERPEVFRYEKDVSFLAQHTGGIKRADRPVTICDYALIQDLAFAGLSRSREHQKVMRLLWQHLSKAILKPTLTVHLLCNEDEQLRRIGVRGREEEQRIDVRYLAALNRSIDETIKSVKGRIIEVRSDAINFKSDRHARRELAERIFARLEVFRP